MCSVMTTKWSCEHWTRDEIRRCDRYLNNELCRLRWQFDRRDDNQCPDCEALLSIVTDFAKMQPSCTPARVHYRGPSALALYNTLFVKT